MQKTICITGASSGLGKACAGRFTAEGWRMILRGRRADRLQALGIEGADKTDIQGWDIMIDTNINTVEVMPVCQSCGPLAIHRDE